MSLVRESLPYLSDEQWGYLMKMVSILGDENVVHFCQLPPDQQVDRINRFKGYETSLLDHIQRTVSAATANLSATPSPPPVVQQTGVGAKPIRLDVRPYGGTEGENLLFWFEEVKLAIGAALITEEHLKVAFAISQLTGRARDWAMTRITTFPGCFPSWEFLVNAMRETFLPANAAYRQRSAFLACKQGNRGLQEYVQELRVLCAGMVNDPLPEPVKVTVFMEGLKIGPPRTQLFRMNPSTLDETFAIALQEDYCQRIARGRVVSFDGPTPMEINAAEQQRGNPNNKHHIRCYNCQRLGHYANKCPQKKKPSGGQGSQTQGQGAGNADTQ